MRLFVGMPPPEHLQAQLAFEASARYKGPFYKLVEAKNLHVTLCFLGERSEEEKNQIAKDLKRVKQGPFRVTLEEWGNFGTRVFFAGVGEGRDEMHGLARSVHEAALEPFSRFHAHVTVARGKKGKGDRPPQLPEAELNHSFKAKEFVLYKSTLTPKGPRYTALERYLLED